MKRISTKIGDIFSVKIDSNYKKYLQYILNDLTQLNSNVIRVFKELYPIDAEPDLFDITKGEVDFYAHCITKWGIKLGYWEKVGNVDEVGKCEVLFRNTNDAGGKIGELIETSYNWHIWRANDKHFTRVGRLLGENRKAEIGIVISPDSIVHRIKTGDYDFVYPGYE